MGEVAGLRTKVAWPIVAVWAITLISIIAAKVVHPQTDVILSLAVSQFAFNTDSTSLLGPSDNKQILVSNLNYIDIQGSHLPLHDAASAQNLGLTGTASSSCAFYNVRASGIGLVPPTNTKFQWVPGPRRNSVAVMTHSAQTLTLTSQPGPSGVTCARVRTHDDPTSQQIDLTFDPAGGTSVTIATNGDSRIDLVGTVQTLQQDQIRLLGTVRIEQVDPKSGVATSVLIDPPAGATNQATFPSLAKTTSVPAHQLVSFVAGRAMYLTHVEFKDGIQLVIEGKASDLRVGPGAADESNILPTLLDQCMTWKASLALVPSIAGFIILLLEKFGLLTKHEEVPLVVAAKLNEVNVIKLFLKRKDIHPMQLLDTGNLGLVIQLEQDIVGSSSFHSQDVAQELHRFSCGDDTMQEKKVFAWMVDVSSKAIPFPDTLGCEYQMSSEAVLATLLKDFPYTDTARADVIQSVAAGTDDPKYTMVVKGYTGSKDVLTEARKYTLPWHQPCAFQNLTALVAGADPKSLYTGNCGSRWL